MLLKVFPGIVHRFPGGFRNAIYSSHACLDQLNKIQQEDLGKFMNISKHFSRGKIKIKYVN
jgi:hypothetical protein